MTLPAILDGPHGPEFGEPHVELSRDNPVGGGHG